MKGNEMPPKSPPDEKTTLVVSEDVFREVYDSPRSLPGKDQWMTTDEDVRVIEQILGMEPKTIGAPLWVSGDTRNCPKCGREINWLDIVGSALARQHGKELLVRVILGERKFVNVEAPRAIENLVCYTCKEPIRDLRSFKCHNWAYAFEDLQKVVARVTAPGT
jgi:hypothetical protein